MPDLDDDPFPLRSGTCEAHGEFCNFSGKCLTCDREESHA
jgi:hypothetical protein